MFAGLYGLEGIAGDEAAKRAVGSPGDYVLKPQREGGGHNLYGQQLVEALERLTLEERQAYILMERIRPPSQRAALLRAGQITEVVEAYPF